MNVAATPDYHGYSIYFEWDRAYFMPIMQAYCFCFGWIPILFAVLLLYLLFNHSPMYSKEFRNAIAVYHSIQMFYDIHHSYLFNPYPLFPMPIFVCNGFLCRWGAPTRLLMTFTGLIASCGSVGLSTVVFMRLRNLLPLESRFRLSVRQSFALMGFTAVVFVSNSIGMALYAGDDPRKEDILNRSEFSWIRQRPDALVWGDMFDTPALNTEITGLTFTLIYGLVFYPGILIYSAVALHRGKKELLKLTSRKVSNDQGNRMLQIQLWGSTCTFLLPLGLLISIVKLGAPTSNKNVHSVIRFLGMFLFVNNTMVAIVLHLMMNRMYQKIITYRVKRLFSTIKLPRRTEATMTASQAVSGHN